MKEARDPAIKLFGRTLAFSGQDCGDCEGEYGRCDHDRISLMAACLEDKKDCRAEEEGGEDENKDPQAGIPDGSKQDKSTTPESLPESDESPKTHSSVEETAVEKPLNTETDQSDTNSSPQEKQPLKKPDKILPCPRCNSMDTKFCYYNNYNVNQPRHFCKTCQRYWTAGGTMRSVPVGAGRRKNKNSAASHYRHITFSESEALHAPNGIHQPPHRTNAKVLSFGLEAPVPESMASVLNIAAKRTANGACNGFYKVENSGENGDDCSSGSSITTSNSTEERARNGIQESIMKQATQCMGLSPIPCLPGVPWPYPWNSAVPIPSFCPNGFPTPYYPAPYWNYSVPCAWSTVPWLSPQPPPPPPPPPTNQKPPTLGKHSRDGDLLEPSNPFEKEPFVEPKNTERSSILIPKTLRIDDPDEAARSSIWATLGIKNDFTSRRGLFEGFQPKDEEKKKLKADTPPAALLANPAALSRSLSFQEGM